MFVIGFDQPHKAEEACLKLQELQGKYVLDIQDTVIALEDEKGKVKLQQRESLLTAESQVFPGFCGSLTVTNITSLLVWRKKSDRPRSALHLGTIAKGNTGP